MFATTPIRSMPTSRQSTGGIANLSGVGAPIDVFKKSPSAADLRRLGRHLAKQQGDADHAQLPATILCSHDYSNRENLTVEQTMAGRGRDRNLTAAASATDPSETGVAATEERAGVCWMESRPVVATAPGVTREMCDAEF
ncbi:hypothetical protein LOC51_30485 [Rubrivivax sp. JA1024]|nr:hypothetical protein [Rubrivivax sp. JA1024]